MVSWLGKVKAGPQDSQYKPGWPQAHGKQTKPHTVHLLQENQQGLRVEVVYPKIKVSLSKEAKNCCGL